MFYQNNSNIKFLLYFGQHTLLTYRVVLFWKHRMYQYSLMFFIPFVYFLSLLLIFLFLPHQIVSLFFFNFFLRLPIILDLFSQCLPRFLHNSIILNIFFLQLLVFNPHSFCPMHPFSPNNSLPHMHFSLTLQHKLALKLIIRYCQCLLYPIISLLITFYSFCHNIRTLLLHLHILSLRRAPNNFQTPLLLTAFLQYIHLMLLLNLLNLIPLGLQPHFLLPNQIDSDPWLPYSLLVVRRETHFIPLDPRCILISNIPLWLRVGLNLGEVPNHQFAAVIDISVVKPQLFLPEHVRNRQVGKQGGQGGRIVYQTLFRSIFKQSVGFTLLQSSRITLDNLYCCILHHILSNCGQSTPTIVHTSYE